MAARPYRVSVLGGGSRRFTHLDKAVAFAATQSRASWALEPWTVWDMTLPDGEPEWLLGALNPRYGLGVCVRVVHHDGVSFDPFGEPEYISL